MAMAQRARRTARPAPPPAPTEEIRGKITRVRFYNPDNGYAVMSVYTGREEITAVGNLLDARQDADLILRGAWKDHPKFGKQLCFSEYEIVLPRAREGIVSYLAATVPGIGPVKAAKIADTLGNDALEIIKRDSDQLRAVPGITAEQAEQIVAKVKANETLAELSALICGEGITPNLAAKIYAKYGAEAIKKVTENPYILADEIERIGFITADKIARSVGIALDSPFRIQAAILFLLNEVAESGHVYLRPSEIVAKLPEIVGNNASIDVPKIAAAAEELIRFNRLVREENRIYLPGYRQAEIELARAVKTFMTQSRTEVPEWAVSRAEEMAGIQFAEGQKSALVAALSSPLSVITGGPGTGKTTIINSIMAIYGQMHPEKPIYAAAPTGRAAKRISETSGREGKTIHRLLGYQGNDFFYDARNPMPAGLLIVDEVSMMDLELANHLFAALPPEMKVVLVGDIDQLPSVGAGSVLRDIIDSGVVPVTRLEYNYRQAKGSTIALYANLMREGTIPDLTVRTADFLAYEVDNMDPVSDAVGFTLELIGGLLRDGYIPADFQVLTPQRKGLAGVAALNEQIQKRVNPPAEGKGEIKYGGVTFRVGDKVMQLKNDYEKGVFNGDIGYIVDITTQGKSKRLFIRFDENTVDYNYEDLAELDLAYASTVHKSQGSEFPIVIYLCLRTHYIMLQRNLAYTAITRAKQRLYLVHESRVGRKAGALETAIKNNKIETRNSYLAERLKG